MDAPSEDKRNHSMELKIGKLPRAGEGGFQKKNKKLSPDRTDVLVSHDIGINRRENERREIF